MTTEVTDPPEGATADDGTCTAREKLPFELWDCYMRALKLLRDDPDADFLVDLSSEEAHDLLFAYFRVTSLLAGQLAEATDTTKKAVLRNVAGDIALHFDVTLDSEDEADS